MSTVVPRAPREARISYAPLPDPMDARGPPLSSPAPVGMFNRPPPMPYDAMSIMPHDGGFGGGGSMPHPVGRRQLQTYRPMAEELKKYIGALAGPTER